MKVAFITRSTLYKILGGSGVQALETAKELSAMGVEVSIHLANEKIAYDQFDLLHFFDITRPANILHHIHQTNKPFVISPILVDYHEYDQHHRRGLAGFFMRLLPASSHEYLKTILRWILRRDALPSKSYIWKGQHASVKEILRKAAFWLPNSQAEYEAIKRIYGIDRPYYVVPNGINIHIFQISGAVSKEENMALCAARIEGLKNQLNLIRAVNGTKFRLVIAGDAGPGQRNYYKRCRQAAAGNIEFTGRISQEELAKYYLQAKVHILPSWFETCGLSSLEAAAMGCNIVITDKGFAREYFGDKAFYCDPGQPSSIYQAIEMAAKQSFSGALSTHVRQLYTWKNAAAVTLAAYKKLLDKKQCYQLPVAGNQ